MTSWLQPSIRKQCNSAHTVAIAMLCCAVLLCVACTSPVSGLQLPVSNYYNSLAQQPGEGLTMELTQVGSDSVQVSFGDTVVFALDSNLHYGIFSAFDPHLHLDNHPRAFQRIRFNHNYPFSRIEVLQGELKKLGLLQLQWVTSGNHAIYLPMPPLCEGETVYLHPAVVGKYVLPPPPPKSVLSELLADESTVIATHNGHTVQFSRNGQMLLSLAEHVALHGKIRCLYQLNNSNTYQHYIQLLDVVFTTTREVRLQAMREQGLDEQAANAQYRIAVMRYKAGT